MEYYKDAVKEFLSREADKDPEFLEANATELYFKLFEGGIPFKVKATYFESDVLGKAGFTMEYMEYGQNFYKGSGTFWLGE